MSVVWLNFDRSNTSEVKFNLYSVVAINWFIFLRVTLTRFPLIKSSIPTQIKARSLDSRWIFWFFNVNPLLGSNDQSESVWDNDGKTFCIKCHSWIIIFKYSIDATWNTSVSCSSSLFAWKRLTETLGWVGLQGTIKSCPNLAVNKFGSSWSCWAFKKTSRSLPVK